SLSLACRADRSALGSCPSVILANTSLAATLARSGVSTSAEPSSTRRVAPARRYCTIHDRSTLPPAPARSRKPKPVKPSSKKMASVLPSSRKAATVLASSFIGPSLGKRWGSILLPPGGRLVVQLERANTHETGEKQGHRCFPATGGWY